MQDENFMRAALRQAKTAQMQGEVPIGAVIVKNGKVIAQERNRVEELSDASAHAELLCLRAAAKQNGPAAWRLSGSTLYCTVEPCPMCLAAIHAFRVDRLVYGAPNPRLGAIEGGMRLPSNHPFHSIQVTRGQLRSECAELMQQFFRRRRQDPLWKRDGDEGKRREESLDPYDIAHTCSNVFKVF